jgi:hypothetical protein
MTQRTESETTGRRSSPPVHAEADRGSIMVNARKTVATDESCFAPLGGGDTINVGSPKPSTFVAFLLELLTTTGTIEKT